MAMRSCGCKTGAVFMGVAVVGWPVWALQSMNIVAAVLLYPVVVLVAAVVGKLIGMVIERA